MSGWIKRCKKPILLTILPILIVGGGYTYVEVSRSDQKASKAQADHIKAGDVQESADSGLSFLPPTQEEIEANLSPEDLELWREAEEKRLPLRIYWYGQGPGKPGKRGPMVLLEVDGKKIHADPNDLYALNVKLTEEPITPEIVEGLLGEVAELRQAGETITPELVWEMYEQARQGKGAAK
ncbi:MAG: hypothetical protein IBX64_02185 [Actinobacteria bacterium]|nr:hypothetical protein [Actinomycetota bacterium]